MYTCMQGHTINTNTHTCTHILAYMHAHMQHVFHRYLVYQVIVISREFLRKNCKIKQTNASSSLNTWLVSPRRSCCYYSMVSIRAKYTQVGFLLCFGRQELIKTSKHSVCSRCSQLKQSWFSKTRVDKSMSAQVDTTLISSVISLTSFF